MIINPKSYYLIPIHHKIYVFENLLFVINTVGNFVSLSKYFSMSTPPDSLLYYCPSSWCPLVGYHISNDSEEYYKIIINSTEV